MKTEDLCWEAFGFPNPGFMPVWKPAEGLMKALAERQLPFAGKWEIDPIAETDHLKKFQECGRGQSWCVKFDRQLKEIAVRYLNHLKMSDPSDLSDVTEAMWTWDELLLEAADGEEDAIADPEKGDLSPEWNLVWLMQRRKAIDLLRYAPVPYQYDFLSGSTHTGIPSSPAESIAAALSGLNTGTGNGLPGTSITLIYGPDHGWREGSYCCDVIITRKIYAELPEGFEPEGNIYLVIKVNGADGSDDFFAAADQLSPGVNVLTADADGVFIEFDESDLTGDIPTPTTDHTTSGGWRATFCTAFADYSKIFHFKEKE